VRSFIVLLVGLNPLQAAAQKLLSAVDEWTLQDPTRLAFPNRSKI
jgi:hypothetical protein